MKVTKYLLAVLVLTFIVACDSDDNRSFSNENGRFARFFLQLDGNDDPIVFPNVELGRSATEFYSKDNVKTLKIPVALTSEPLNETVTLSYRATITGLDNVILEPTDEFTFSGNQLVDTLFIRVNELWDSSLNPTIDLKLLESSDPDITIGAPNDQLSNDELLINFSDLSLQYSIVGPSRVDVTGTSGEQVAIDVNFPNGYIQDDLDNFEFFTATQSNFNFRLERQQFISDDLVRLTFTIEEDFTNDDLRYRTNLAINPLDGYTQNGSPFFTIIREPLTIRDKSVNTASQFYDAGDPFYRTYGIHWFDDNNSGLCEWSNFNAFTNPVIVSADDPNAILADDNGTTDPSDDIYYHAFRISFNTFLENRTTNPFNLKRWFTNEGTNGDTSPGFNIIPALEFFPANGTSTTQGTVQVIEQTIQIGTTQANGGITEFFNIDGIGTYQEISPGLIEISVDINLTNNRLFGGTRTDTYRIYNSSNFTDPADLMIDCKVPISLQ
ncbi:hypothetical protein SAMN05192588_1384 [Nonlabens sp. Hel1_33_55]|uniref:hypothetical protein n=1 Tax=Nonlabens sp. Hel1_33_55 TaxID=1336802 RepID=UPI000875AA57|nr:hypothetical protein [Nonlabens sp. Hel1_33_55]SCY14848.1 hypothetical protein SAMN05192588_1384 [Nonlabens sp. Hel1_33_55]